VESAEMPMADISQKSEKVAKISISLIKKSPETKFYSFLKTIDSNRA
jgi:hypothetical protein